MCLLAMHTSVCVTFSLPPGVRGWLRLLLVALPGLFCLPFSSNKFRLLNTNSFLGVGYPVPFKTFKMGIPQTTEERQKTHIVIQGLKSKASILTDDIIPQLGAADIIIRRHFRSPLLIQTFISVASPQTIRD